MDEILEVNDAQIEEVSEVQEFLVVESIDNQELVEDVCNEELVVNIQEELEEIVLG